MSYPILFGNMAGQGSPLFTTTNFNSFGIVSGQSKGTSYTAYSGGSPTGTLSNQYSRMTSNVSGRPGGLTYTDIVLNDEFFICFFSSHSSDGYNAIFLYDEDYGTFTHTQLGGNNIQDYGYSARYGTYIQNSIMDIWDGRYQAEGSGGNAGTPSVPGYATSGYIGVRRDANGKFYTYWSASAPGSAGYSNMTLIHGPSVTTYSGRVRLGIFIHDSAEYLEVYSPGTSIKKYPSFVSDHLKSNWTLASSNTGNSSSGSGNYFASESSQSYKFALSGNGTNPSSFFVAGPLPTSSYYRAGGTGGTGLTFSYEFYFAGKEVCPTNYTIYTYPENGYQISNAAFQRWTGSSWETVAGIGSFASQSGWSFTSEGLHSTDSYTTPGRMTASATFTGTRASANNFKSKYWRLYAPANFHSGTDVPHILGSGPLNFWTFS